MKRNLFNLLLGVTMLFASCETLKKVASILTPSEFEMITGLKDALSQGLFKSFDAFADPNGNPLVQLSQFRGLEFFIQFQLAKEYDLKHFLLFRL